MAKPATETKERFYSLSDAAKKLNVSRQTLYNAVRRKELKTYKFGHYTAISENDMERLNARLRPLTVGDKEILVFSAVV